jgi:hypothetical protein
MERQVRVPITQCPDLVGISVFNSMGAGRQAQGRDTRSRGWQRIMGMVRGADLAFVIPYILVHCGRPFPPGTWSVSECTSWRWPECWWNKDIAFPSLGLSRVPYAITNSLRADNISSTMPSCIGSPNLPAQPRVLQQALMTAFFLTFQRRSEEIYGPMATVGEKRVEPVVLCTVDPSRDRVVFLQRSTYKGPGSVSYCVNEYVPHASILLDKPKDNVRREHA